MVVSMKYVRQLHQVDGKKTTFCITNIESEN